MTRKCILILGIGNLLLCDEGVGIHVIRQLKKMPIPSEVLVVDGGTGGYELIQFFEGMEKVIIVDAVKADVKAGTVMRLFPEYIAPPQFTPYSIHQDGLFELLKKAKDLNRVPEIVIYGIAIKETKKFGLNLSNLIKKSISKVIYVIQKEIQDMISHD